jgi:glycerophosphoryl diester phosphodiesterase
MTKRATPQQPFAGADAPLVFAHRGGAGRWPENTMLAFRNAVALGVDALELDIHSTADGHLVVCHDATLDRTTDGAGPIHAYTLDELQQFDAGYWWSDDGGRTYRFRGQGLAIPTFRQVLSEFPRLWINIDLKQSTPPIIEPFLELIREMEMVEQVCTGSLNVETVVELRRQCPEMATAAHYNEVRRLFVLSRMGLGHLYQGEATAMQIPSVDKRRRIVTPGFVQGAHAGNTAVHVWTVDDVPEMVRLIEMGVDGLMTDYPDLLLKLLGRYRDEESG